MIKRTTAFTLIELLIVVAIIAILAAIAVPNFLDAQTRSKVSRVKTDLRCLELAIQSYSVDHTHPPVDWSVPKGDPQYEWMIENSSGMCHPGGIYPDGSLHAGLTTPITYIANCWIRDPFTATDSKWTMRPDTMVYTYNPFGPNPLHGRPIANSYISRGYQEFYGNWRIGSVGPDRKWFNGEPDTAGSLPASRIYDPTNGTVSIGNIWRSEKHTNVDKRPQADMLLDPNG